jgi:hypothetical protein
VQKGDFKNFAKNPQCFIKLNDPDPRDPGEWNSIDYNLAVEVPRSEDHRLAQKFRYETSISLPIRATPSHVLI